MKSLQRVRGGGLVGGGLTVVLNVITYSRRRDSGAEIKAQLFTCENPLHHYSDAVRSLTVSTDTTVRV